MRHIPVVNTKGFRLLDVLDLHKASDSMVDM